MTPFEKWKSGSSYKHVVNPVAVAMLKATWNACTLAAEKVCREKANHWAPMRSMKATDSANACSDCADDIANLREGS